MMKKILLLGILLLPSAARADFSIICGENRAKGAEHADVAFVNHSGAPMRIFVGGKEIPEDQFGIKGLEGDQWMVGIDRGAGKSAQQFVFDHASSSVEEFSISPAGKEKKMGKNRKCDWKEKPSKE